MKCGGEWGSWSTKLSYRFLNKTYDWEIEVVASFFNLLCSNMPFCEGSDRLKWKFRKNGAFDVWSCPFMMHFWVGMGVSPSHIW